MRLIDADELRKKIVARVVHGEDKIDRGFNLGIGAALDLLNVAPTVEEERDADAYETGYLQGHVDGYLKAEKDYANPRGECEKCNFRKFSETFVDVLADAMKKKGITSAEQFQEILKGGADLQGEGKT